MEERQKKWRLLLLLALFWLAALPIRAASIDMEDVRTLRAELTVQEMRLQTLGERLKTLDDISTAQAIDLTRLQIALDVSKNETQAARASLQNAETSLANAQRELDACAKSLKKLKSDEKRKRTAWAIAAAAFAFAWACK